VVIAIRVIKRMPNALAERDAVDMEFWDLSVEERNAAYDKAERETGKDFFELSADQKNYYYDQATKDHEDDRDSKASQ
jgi:hypothetical protein